MYTHTHTHIHIHTHIYRQDNTYTHYGFQGKLSKISRDLYQGKLTKNIKGLYPAAGGLIYIYRYRYMYICT